MKNKNNQEKKQTLLSKVGSFVKANACEITECVILSVYTGFWLNKAYNYGVSVGMAASMQGLNHHRDAILDLADSFQGYTTEAIVKTINKLKK